MPNRRRLTLAALLLLVPAAHGAAWEQRAAAQPYVVQRILWFRTALALLDGDDPDPFLGRLKTVLAAPDVRTYWDMAAVLDRLESRLALDHHALLTALVAALGDESADAALDAFELWRDAEPLPLDRPGPANRHRARRANDKEPRTQ